MRTAKGHSWTLIEWTSIDGNEQLRGWVFSRYLKRLELPQTEAKAKAARSTWNRVLREHGHEKVRPFVKLAVENGLDSVLYAHTSLQTLRASTSRLWDEPGLRAIVRPTRSGYHLEGYDPETNEKVVQDVPTEEEALALFARFLQYLAASRHE
jgi:hypothetical protein